MMHGQKNIKLNRL